MNDQELIELVYGRYTKASKARLQAMIDACRYVEDKNIEGDIVECGVWRAGHIILARKILPSRVCWLYDTFSGMTEPSNYDHKPDGYPAMVSYRAKAAKGQKWAEATRSEVEINLRMTNVFNTKLCKFVEGDVRKTLDDPLNVPDKIAILRLDTDFYDSTKKELEVLWPKLVDKGVLIVDDFHHWDGSRRACQDYFIKNKIQQRWKRVGKDDPCVLHVKGD